MRRQPAALAVAIGLSSVSGQILRDWGLHLIDANLAMGNLVEIVRRPGEARTAAHS